MNWHSMIAVKIQGDWMSSTIQTTVTTISLQIYQTQVLKELSYIRIQNYLPWEFILKPELNGYKYGAEDMFSLC